MVGTIDTIDYNGKLNYDVTNYKISLYINAIINAIVYEGHFSIRKIFGTI